ARRPGGVLRLGRPLAVRRPAGRREQRLQAVPDRVPPPLPDPVGRRLRPHRAGGEGDVPHVDHGRNPAQPGDGRGADAAVAVEGAILPGFAGGDVGEVAAAAGAPAVLGPKDLRDLPEFFGTRSGPPPGYGAFDIEILAEINHAPTKPPAAVLAEARRYRASGA